MTTRTAAQVFAATTAALTDGSDVTDILDHLVLDSAEVLGAHAIGVLVVSGSGELELLSATSHQVTELELFQIQQHAGPCVDTIRTGTATSYHEQDELQARWPQVGAAIAQAGYRAVHAYPMRWHGQTLGALNAFHRTAAPQSRDAGLLGQALADIATVVLVQAFDLTSEQVTGRVQQALQARTVIEQAKGVLAYTHNLDMAAAYEFLRRLATDHRTPITATAGDIVDRARNKG
jgi:transcriptional regulator with GAF, ATPase, and Fis domain